MWRCFAVFMQPKLVRMSAYNSRTMFQQDETTCHTSDTSMEVVKEMFSGKVISRRGDIIWPPRSPDLTPTDIFLWFRKQNVRQQSKNSKSIKGKLQSANEIDPSTNIPARISKLKSQIRGMSYSSRASHTIWFFNNKWQGN